MMDQVKSQDNAQDIESSVLPGGGNEASSSGGVTSINQPHLYGVSSAMMTKMLQNPPIMSSGTPTPLYPPPTMLQRPFLDYTSGSSCANKSNNPVTPSLTSAGSSTSSNTKTTKSKSNDSNNGSSLGSKKKRTSNALSSSNNAKLESVAAVMQSTSTNGVIVPGVSINISSSKNNNSLEEGSKPPKRQRRISSMAAMAAAAGKSTSTTTLGGVTIPNVHPQASTAMKVQVAAATAAASAAPLKPKGGHNHAESNADSENLTPVEKAKQNRDRNREHARSTRLRKKAYVNKLKELVEGLHFERTEEVRKSRVSVQHLAEMQAVRKSVVRSFLMFLGVYECDERKWGTILEDEFCFKQPVTPYRSFPRLEIENACRYSRGVEAMIIESASMSVMIESIGSRSARWNRIKREEFLIGQSDTPGSVLQQNSNNQIVDSSLSSSSTGEGSGEEDQQKMGRKVITPSKFKKQTVGSSPGNSSALINDKNGTNAISTLSNNNGYHHNKPSNEFHDYNAPSLPDPKLDSGSGSDSNSGYAVNGTSTDSSSADEDSNNNNNNAAANNAPPAEQPPKRTGLPANIAKMGGISHNVRTAVPTNPKALRGIDRLNLAPAIELPPFVGLGKRASTAVPMQTVSSGNVGVGGVTSKTISNNAVKSNANTNNNTGSTNKKGNNSNDNDTSSSSSTLRPRVRASYHVNEDDMLLTDNVLMCSFLFRSQGAVDCGALSECIMPGMLRAHFSSRNKLLNVEMIYDAMGFMQQLERASGREGKAQIIPNSLEMALVPTADEARVITLAKAPFQIICVNEAWTRMTKYTQMDAEGKTLKILEDKRTDLNAGVRSGKPVHDLAQVASSRCACSVNRHYDKHGFEYIEYTCSYPLSNANHEVTHILHICKELPPPTPAQQYFNESIPAPISCQ